MLLTILAAAAVAAQAGSTTVSGLEVRPAPKVDVTVKVEGDDNATGHFLAVWPEAAYDSRINGQVTLNCMIDAHGLAEWCEIASETPPNKGFGKAALELRTTFKLMPRMGADGPVESVMSIAVGFKAPDPLIVTEGTPMQGSTANCGMFHPCPMTHIVGAPLALRSVTMLDHPIWVSAADFDDLAKAYPAKADGVEGFAVAHCHVLRTGELGECQVIKETPEKHGFGSAALALARKFRVAPALAAARQRNSLWVDIPIRFPPPAQAPDRTLVSPTWLASFDPGKVVKLFPPEAAAQGLTTGRGVARCVVAPGGALTACAPDPGDPDGLGFSEAAVKLASTMKMNPWASGGPVDGAVIRVPIRLNLKAPK